MERKKIMNVQKAVRRHLLKLDEKSGWSPSSIHSMSKKVEVSIPSLADKKDLTFIHVRLVEPHHTHTAGMSPDTMKSFNELMTSLGFELINITGSSSLDKLDEDGKECNVLTLVYEVDFSI